MGRVGRGRACGCPEYGFAPSSCYDARLGLLRYRPALRLALQCAFRGTRPCFHERPEAPVFLRDRSRSCDALTCCVSAEAVPVENKSFTRLLTSIRSARMHSPQVLYQLRFSDRWIFSID